MGSCDLEAKCFALLVCVNGCSISSGSKNRANTRNFVFNRFNVMTVCVYSRYHILCPYDRYE